jgi:hypothetical protein
MPKETSEKPEKSGAEQVLEALGPRLDAITKDLEEIKSHRQPSEKSEKVISNATGNDDNHRALKQQHPDWKFCPYGEDCGELPAAEIDPVNTESPDNPRVKCSTCGSEAFLKWKRCPGCGATDNFEPAD